jgi:hypothetical protein
MNTHTHTLLCIHQQDHVCVHFKNNMNGIVCPCCLSSAFLIWHCFLSLCQYLWSRYTHMQTRLLVHIFKMLKRFGALTWPDKWKIPHLTSCDNLQSESRHILVLFCPACLLSGVITHYLHPSPLLPKVKDLMDMDTSPLEAPELSFQLWTKGWQRWSL